MAATKEKLVKTKVAALLKERGVYYFSPATFGMGRSGVPDIICCHLGKFIGVECKAGVNKPTELQKRELAAIEKAGGVALIINETNLDLLTQALNTIERGH